MSSSSWRSCCKVLLVQTLRSSVSVLGQFKHISSWTTSQGVNPFSNNNAPIRLATSDAPRLDLVDRCVGDPVSEDEFAHGCPVDELGATVELAVVPENLGSVPEGGGAKERYWGQKMGRDQGQSKSDGGRSLSSAESMRLSSDVPLCLDAVS